MPIGGLADVLSRMLDRSVIDKTGLTGKFDFQAQFTPDDKPSAGFSEPFAFRRHSRTARAEAEPQKGPVEIFVIEGAQKPTEN
jgi:uncharacterized protein (TIGR03435 family)